jgi:hypothetical protein
MQWTRGRKIALTFAGLLIALTVAGLGFFFVFNPLCTNQQVARSVSPDGKRALVVFVRQCSADRPEGTHVSMYNGEAVLRSWHMGNVLIMRARSEGARAALPRVEWLDANKAAVILPEGAEVLRSAERFEDVAIEQRR